MVEAGRREMEGEREEKGAEGMPSRSARIQSWQTIKCPFDPTGYDKDLVEALGEGHYTNQPKYHMVSRKSLTYAWVIKVISLWFSKWNWKYQMFCDEYLSILTSSFPQLHTIIVES